MSNIGLAEINLFNSLTYFWYIFKIGVLNEINAVVMSIILLINIMANCTAKYHKYYLILYSMNNLETILIFHSRLTDISK